MSNNLLFLAPHLSLTNLRIYSFNPKISNQNSFTAQFTINTKRRQRRQQKQRFIVCKYSDDDAAVSDTTRSSDSSDSDMQIYSQIERLITDTAKQAQGSWGASGDWNEIEVKSYYGVSTNLLMKFKDDMIDETPTLTQILTAESAVSSSLDLSIRTIPGDHGLPLQQVFPDVPPVMADAVNQAGEILTNMATGTPLESVAKEVRSTFSADAKIIRAQNSKNVDMLTDVVAAWISSNSKTS